MRLINRLAPFREPGKPAGSVLAGELLEELGWHPKLLPQPLPENPNLLPAAARYTVLAALTDLFANAQTAVTGVSRPEYSNRC